MSTRVVKDLGQSRQKMSRLRIARQGRTPGQAWRRIRDLAIAELSSNGWSHRDIAEIMLMARSRVSDILREIRAEADAVDVRKN